MKQKIKDSFDNLVKGENASFVLWLYPIFSGVILIGLPWLLTRGAVIDSFAFNDTGEIGDTIGGITGPIIGLTGALVTFFAFWVQFKSNISQTAQFNKQDKDTKVDRFESKFYEMISLHRANLDEMNIADRIKGRKCFTQLFYELRACYLIAADKQKSLRKKKKSRRDFDLLDFSYTIFFFGIGPNSEKNYSHNFTDFEKQLFQACKDTMEIIQDEYKQYKKRNPDAKSYSALVTSRKMGSEQVQFKYQPFHGHSDLLGHYYRQLFQTVKFIDDSDLFDDQIKYTYMKTVRAQLSNYEQLMLYYNSSAWFPGKWKRFFTDFRLIKNIPLGLADFDISPLARYQDDIARLKAVKIKMFENI